MWFKRILTFFTLSLLFLNAAPKVELGVDRFFSEKTFETLKGKRIGLITNQTGVNSQLTTTIDLFLKNQGQYNLTALFAPEHGIDGKTYAYKQAENGTKHKDIPIYNLYGSTKRPTAEMLSKIDVLVYDIQDVGSRAYTYTTTLFYAMEEAAKAGKSVIVLDRPNPMNGVIVDGPMLQENFRSYMGYINVPYCHGMTIGELALFFNKEYKIGTKLTVIPMKGWKREMVFSDTGLSWIPTSPQIPESDTPLYYATTGILGEFSLINIGVGYTLPFKVIGAPWINAEHFAHVLNSQKIEGVTFHPFHYRPFFGSFKGLDCHGVKIHITNPSVYKPLTVQYFIIGILKSLYPNTVAEKLNNLKLGQKKLFCQAWGNDVMIKMLINEKYVSWKLIDFQKKERETFILKRKKYLLYQ